MAEPWASTDFPPSDDDDEGRLMIDTSGDDEDSVSQSSGSGMPSGPLPLNFTPEVLPARMKALADAKPTLDKLVKDVVIPPQLNKYVKHVSAGLLEEDGKERPEKFYKVMSQALSSPDFYKAICEIDLTPGLEQALDQVNQVRCPKRPRARNTKILSPGCDRTTTKSNEVGDNPLIKLEDLVSKPIGTQFNPNAYPSDMTMISTAPVGGKQGCELVPILAPPKRARARQAGSASVRSKTVPTGLPNSVSLRQTPPEQDFSKIRNVVNQLQNAANDVEQMRELQCMSGSAEFNQFREFRTNLRRLKDLSVTTPTFNTLTNRRVIENTTIPPALTITPTSSLQRINNQGRNDSKSGYRRGPPPMFPIESLNNFRKPLTNDHVVQRLKRLGTDIELESISPRTYSPGLPFPVMDYSSSYVPECSGDDDDDDDDSMISAVPVDCILSTEPIVTINEIPNAPPLRYFDVDPPISRRSNPPPPPSLIPISTCTTAASQFLSLPSSSRTSHTVKQKRKPKTTTKSKFAQLAHALVQPAGTVKNNDVDILNKLYQPSSFQNETVTMEREVEIFKIIDGPPPKNVKKQENTSQSSSIETIVKRLKDKPEIKTASQSTVAGPSEANFIPEISLMTEAPLELPKDLETVINDVQLAKNSMEEPSNSGEIASSSAALNELASTGNEKTRDEINLEALPVAETSSQSPSLFVFNQEKAMRLEPSPPNGRKRWACAICSGVYCKTISLKKHYFRDHINPNMVSEEDARKLGLKIDARKSPANEGFYRCLVCLEIFTEMTDLKKHQYIHPLAVNGSSERNKKTAPIYSCDNCIMTFTKKKLYQEHLSNCARVVDMSAADSIPASVPEPAVTSTSESTSEPINLNNVEEVDEERKDASGISQMCLFCDATFKSTAARKSHVLRVHPPKKRNHACSYCKCGRYLDLKDLLIHICEAHSKEYFGCALCKIRFKTKEDLIAHNAESHAGQEDVLPKTVTSSDKAKPGPSTVTKVKSVSTSVPKAGKTFQCTRCSEVFPSDKELKRHRKKGHNVKKPASAVAKKNSFAFISELYEQRCRTMGTNSHDYEGEFYKNVNKNISFNLDNCLDGKMMDVPNDQKKVAQPGSSRRRTRSRTMQHSNNEQGMGEKLSLQDMYGSENVNGPFIADVSRLHLATQKDVYLKIRRSKEEQKTESASTVPLVPETMARGLALTKNTGEDPAPNVTAVNDKEESIFSGDWVRAKKYFCSVCVVKFSNYGDMETHRWTEHPNVCGADYTFPADQAPGPNWDVKPWLSHKGFLNPTGEQDTSSLPGTVSKCTKCGAEVTPIAEFHKHILECGGDKTWMSTMFASSSLKKNKKWKPYGSRRRRNVGRTRGLKRNIPTTPVKVAGLPKTRQKAGDAETIQKMIANLPPKRITRRAVQFDDIPSTSQTRRDFTPRVASIHESNILTRKRREKLDTKGNTQNANLPSSTQDVPKASNSRKKKTASKKPEQSAHSKASSSPASESSSEPQDRTPSTSSPPASDVDFRIKEEILAAEETPSKKLEDKSESSLVVENLDLPEVKQEDEVSEMNLDEVERADSDSLIPDPSAIIAAMRETIRQTDSTIPSQTFTVASRKRKRDDSKCKSDPSETSESCLGTANKIPATASTVCVDCKNPFTDVGGTNHQMCETCSSKSESTRSVCLRPREPNNRLREVRHTRKSPVPPKSSSERNVERVDDGNGKTFRIQKLMEPETEDNSPENDAVTNEKSKKSFSKAEVNQSAGEMTKVLKTDETNLDSGKPVVNETRKTIRQPKTRSTGKGRSRKRCKTSVEDSSDQMNPDVGSNTVTPELKTTTMTSDDSKTVELDTNLKDAVSTEEIQDIEPDISACEVCKGPSIRPICDSCISIARKNKVCVFCKRENAPKPYVLPMCQTCKDGQGNAKLDASAESKSTSKRELKDWVQCLVCDRNNHRVLCSSCVGMAEKLKICGRCSASLNYPRAKPLCLDCEKIWFPDATEGNVEGTEGPSGSSGTDTNIAESADGTVAAVSPDMEVPLTDAASVPSGSAAAPLSSIPSTSATNTSSATPLSSIPSTSATSTSSATPLSSIPSTSASSTSPATPLASIPSTSASSTSPATPLSAIPSTSATSTSSATPLASMPSTSATSTSSATPLASMPSTSAANTSSAPSTRHGVSALPVVINNNLAVVSNLSTLAVNRSISDETQSSAPPSKKVLLECRGCRTTYARVSMYKLHTEICTARHTNAEEKKPLLGFVNGSSTAAPNDGNNAGPSFEIVETLKTKSFSSNESAKTESHGNNDTFGPGSTYDSDSSTSSKRLLEFSKCTKIKRSFATDESINETIESVIQAMCRSSPSGGCSPSGSAVAHPSSRRPSSDANEVSTTNLVNLEKVGDELEKMLEGSSLETESGMEIQFPDEEGTTPGEPSSLPRAKNVTPKKKKALKRGPTTRSSLAKSEAVDTLEISEKTPENHSSSDDEQGASSTGSVMGRRLTRLRRLPSEVSLSTNRESVSDDADSNSVTMRPRRKQPATVTKRTRYSRLEREIQECIQEMGEEMPSVSRLRGARNKVNAADQTVQKHDEKPLCAAEDQDDKIPSKKPKIESSDPGFPSVKTSKPGRKNAKRGSQESSSSHSKNELAESDCKESDNTSNSSVLEDLGRRPMMGDGSSSAVVDGCLLSFENQLNLSNRAAPSPAIDEAPTCSRYLSDESMYSDGYEAGGSILSEERQRDGTEASTWSPFLEVESLGSILDSVNELLSRPEVVSYCVADTIKPRPVEDSQIDGLTLFNDRMKIKEDHSFELEDESPTLMDLDHQTAHHSGKMNEEREVKMVSLDGEQLIESCSMSSSDSKEEMSYSDLKALKGHMSRAHDPNASTTRNTANGKLRSSARTNLNRVKNRQECSHCQKTFVSKREMASHVDEHVTKFATNQGCDATALRKGIAEKLELLFYNKALGNASLRTSAQLNTAKKNQFGAWKSAVTKRLQSDPFLDEMSEYSSVSSSTTRSMAQSKNTPANSPQGLSDDDCYPCPICSKSFRLTVQRNQHIIFMHAPRQSTHPAGAQSAGTPSPGTPSPGTPPPVLMDENNSAANRAPTTDGPSCESSGKSGGKVIHSYLLNESVDSCLEAKKEAVQKAMTESTARNNTNELRKQVGRPASTLASQSVPDLRAIEGPPALEPAPSGEHILNNTDRSPPKLEVSTGVPGPSVVPTPSILRKNLTSSSSSGAVSTSSASRRNGKPCRKKMSKKEINLPPAVVKFKAEQALLELSINKFRKIRTNAKVDLPSDMQMDTNE